MAHKNVEESISHLKNLVTNYEELLGEYTKLKTKYNSKVEAHKRKKEAAAASASAGAKTGGKKPKNADAESLSDTPATKDSVKKERAPPKCSICRKPKKEGDHSKCATELAKKREAKKNKAKETKGDGGEDESASSSESD